MRGKWADEGCNHVNMLAIIHLHYNTYTLTASIPSTEVCAKRTSVLVASGY